MKDSHLLIIGAGGSAKAIAVEAMHRAAKSITIINRTLRNAEMLAGSVQGVAYDFDNFNQPDCYDIVIHTIPANAGVNEMIMDKVLPYLASDGVFMNIDYSPHAKELNACSEKTNCQIVKGDQMYVNQALRQLLFWFPAVT